MNRPCRRRAAVSACPPPAFRGFQNSLPSAAFQAGHACWVPPPAAFHHNGRRHRHPAAVEGPPRSLGSTRRWLIPLNANPPRSCPRQVVAPSAFSGPTYFITIITSWPRVTYGAAGARSRYAHSARGAGPSHSWTVVAGHGRLPGNRSSDRLRATSQRDMPHHALARRAPPMGPDVHQPGAAGRGPAMSAPSAGTVGLSSPAP